MLAEKQIDKYLFIFNLIRNERLFKIDVHKYITHTHNNLQSLFGKLFTVQKKCSHITWLENCLNTFKNRYNTFDTH